MLRRSALTLGATLLAVASLAGSRPTQAAPDSYYFPETRHTVGGAFWAYWQSHGGIGRQGFPITEEFQERSAATGQSYTVQYFERAVFERHPENASPYDVLLTPLGTGLLQARYPAARPPGQWQNPDHARAFAETGHTVGGAFYAYWQRNGGLAQFGYPLTDEFLERSAVDGRIYTVQYFERAVFEHHPEAPAGYSVQLSLLGVMHYRERYETIRHPGPTQQPPAPGLPPPAGKLLLHATFATADLAAWSTPDWTGSPAYWQMLNGHLQQSGTGPDETGDSDTVFVAGDSAWRDIQLEAQFYATSGAPVGVAWRVQPDGRYYRFEVFPNLPNANPKAALELVTNGHVKVLAATSAHFDGYTPEAWHTIRVTARGDRHQASIDDIPLIDVRNEALAQGPIGLYAFTDGATAFDNVRVQQPAP